jgi:diguanylate cyclase (GGDEF)-like protein
MLGVSMAISLEHHRTPAGPLPAKTGSRHPGVRELARLELFAGADPDTLDELLGACEIRPIAAGEVLIAAGVANTDVFIVLSGRLRVHLESPDSEVASLIEAGESVGELSVIDRRPASAWVVADQATRLLVVPHELFWTLIQHSHAVARNLLVCLSQRLRRTDALAAHHNGMRRQHLRQTVVDEVTGLHNRRWFENALLRQVMRSGVSGRPLSLILVDVDRFDRANRAFGDEAGDAILSAVARCLENAVRPTDLVARFGADGFAIALPDATLDNARLVAARVQTDIAGAVMVMDDGSILPPVTVSCGIAALRGGGGVEGLIEDALVMLKEARRAGVSQTRG